MLGLVPDRYYIDVAYGLYSLRLYLYSALESDSFHVCVCVHAYVLVEFGTEENIKLIMIIK